jgi:hypothetical protein
VFCDACGFGLSGKGQGSTSLPSEWTFEPGRYGLFGWLESFLGAVAIIMGYVTLAAFENPGRPLTPLRTAEMVMIIITLLILLFQVVQRWFYREIFAFIYGILAVGGSCCALLVIFNHGASPGSFYIVVFFCWTVAMGCKCFWLACVDLSSTGRFELLEHPLLDSKMKLWVLTGVMLAVNLGGFIVQLIILTTTFEEQ